MPIRVTCQCGQSFAAPDHLAGKRVKCPKCQQPLAIPAAAPATAAAPARQAPAKQPVKQKQPAAAPADDPFGDLNLAPPTALPPRDIFSEAGLQQAVANTVMCPSCSAPMQPNAVLCVKCGYHKALGKKIKGTATAGGGGGDGHGDGGNAQMLLDRAARVIKEDKEEEAKTRAQGMPARGYAGLLFLLFLVTVIFIKFGPLWGIVGALRLGIISCGIGQLINAIPIIVHAFKKTALQGILCLLVPFYIIYYGYQNNAECGNKTNNLLTFWGVGLALKGLEWCFIQAIGALPTGEEETMNLLWNAAQTFLA